uniref:Uncharacterized protein n=1 Tax=Ciona savignyi TaxID=51511 RepID=H2YDM7_CIOSA
MTFNRRSISFCHIIGSCRTNCRFMFCIHIYNGGNTWNIVLMNFWCFSRG